MTPERIAEIEQALANATPGPWKIWGGWGPVPDSAYSDGCSSDLMAFCRIGPEGGGGMVANFRVPASEDFYATREDAELVAQSPTYLREALDRIRELEAALKPLAEPSFDRGDTGIVYSVSRSEVKRARAALGRTE